ncbi:hypothetical protein PTKIN_Ptkin13bG0207800 [Pterospermum kingtungense]
MGVVVPNSADLTDKENGVVKSQEELDAGALFVLKSRGSWLHCGYHLTTSIVGPVIFTLPFALSLLGWAPGVLMIALQALVTFYSYNLLSVVLEHHAQLGKRQLRFRDMARDILGPRWGKYFVGPLQIAICYGAVIGCVLLGGQSLKFIYLLYNQNGKMQLYQFIIIFGAVPLFLAQIPSFHSLRHINLASLLLCLAYSAFVTAGSIHIGYSKNAPSKDYSVKGSTENRILGAINGISIIATTYGCGIIPEIQVLSICLFLLSIFSKQKVSLVGNHSSPSEGQDVQRFMHLFCSGSQHIFQCGSLWILGIWQSVSVNSSFQFYG